MNNNKAKPRKDIVVSICFSDLSATDSAFRTICELAERLDALYRFREIIVIVDDVECDSYLSLVEQVSDLRLFTVHQGIGYYERRVIAAEEAIGDLVLIGNAEEMAHLDLPAMLKQAEDSKSIVLATRSMRPSLLSPITALGRIAGFKLNPRYLQTIALPRTLLNQIISHNEPELALRFPPRGSGLSLFVAAHKVPARNGLAQFRQRMQLLQKLLIYLAPVLLQFVSVSSAILTFVAVGYGLYAVGAWIFIENLAPGWLTTSAMLSVSAFFMGFSMLGLSLGLQQLLNQQEIHMDRTVHEVNRIDLFGKVGTELNIEVERGIRSQNKS